MGFGSGIVALGVSLLVAVVLVLTQKFHGKLTIDGQSGVQKVHSRPTPRVGGVAVVCGVLVGGAFLPLGAAHLWAMIALSAIPAFASGLIEDLTKRVGPKWRLLATIGSGLAFSMLTGLHLGELGIPGVDFLMSYSAFSILFTAFAIGGIANALNIIDGVNGLASGTGIIVLLGFAAVAGLEGDMAILAICLMSAAALLGFFLMNFPAGRIFLGDAGAYSTGFLLAVIAVALPARNPEISPLIGLIALAYPVIETGVSVHRRMVRDGSSPGQPDRLHLHSLVYRSRARQAAGRIGHPALRSGMTSVMLWPLPLLSVAAMVAMRNNTGMLLLSLLAMMLIYLNVYRRVALLRSPLRHQVERPASLPLGEFARPNR